MKKSFLLTRTFCPWLFVIRGVAMLRCPQEGAWPAFGLQHPRAFFMDSGLSQNLLFVILYQPDTLRLKSKILFSATHSSWFCTPLFFRSVGRQSRGFEPETRMQEVSNNGESDMKEKKLESLIDIAIDREVEAYGFYRGLSADSGRLTEKREHQSTLKKKAGY